MIRIISDGMKTEEGDTAGGSMFVSLSIQQLKVRTQQRFVEKGIRLKTTDSFTTTCCCLIGFK